MLSPVFKAALISGTLAFSVSGAFAAESAQSQPHHQNPQSSPSFSPKDQAAQAPRLFATAQTKAALGKMADYIPELAQIDVLIITQADLKKHGYDGDRRGTSAEDIANWNAAFDSVATTLSGFPFERFQPDAVNNTHIKPRYMKAVSSGDVLATPLPAKSEGEKPVLAISIPDLALKSAKQRMAELTGFFGEGFSNIPGSDREWFFLLIVHEIGHRFHKLGHITLLDFFKHEKEADQFAINAYLSDAREVLELGDHHDVTMVPKALVALRGLALLDDRIMGYANSPLLTIPGVSEAVKADSRSLLEVRSGIARDVKQWGREGQLGYMKDYGDTINPHQIRYLAAKELYERGYFENPIQRRYLENFLAGAKLVGNFGIKDKPAPVWMMASP